MKYLILGSGIAAMAAAEAIRERDAEAHIVMISAEEELCFNRPMLIGEFALDGSGAALFEKQQDWPQQFHVEVRLGRAAISIDRASRCVQLADGSCESYDKLIYTLGADVSIPPIPGARGQNVFVVRTREDMRRIRSAMQTARSAVVIGGGMLGLEDAWELHEQKLDVAVIEQRQRLAFGQIDQSAGNLMKKRIERMGVPVYVNATVTEIGDGYVTFTQPAASEMAPVPEDCDAASEMVPAPEGRGAVVMPEEPDTAPELLEENSAAPEAAGSCPGCGGCSMAQQELSPQPELVTIPADLVILSTGVRPNSDLGAAAGLEVAGASSRPAAGREVAGASSRPERPPAEADESRQHAPRWIAVDEYGRTSDPHIFAAGDCAALNGRNDAIWEEARQMGRVAGTNAVLTAAGSMESGDTEATKLAIYEPVTAEHVFTGFDTELFTLADSSGAGTDGVYIRHADVEIFDYQRERYIRASLQDGVLAGVLLINASELAPEMMEAYHRGAAEEEVRQIILRWKDSHEVDFKPAAPFRHR